MKLEREKGRDLNKGDIQARWLKAREARSRMNPNGIFTQIFATGLLRRIPSFCVAVRKELTKSDQVELATVGKPFCRSYYLLVPLTFNDGARWIIRIPACGTPTQFEFSASAALRSEALTMRLIRQKTSIPVPEVIAFDASLDNELGCPYILESFVEGISLYDCWFNKAISTEQLHIRRTRVLYELAHAMAELGQFSFDCGGTPIFDQGDNLISVGPMRSVDHKGMLDRLTSGEKDNQSALYFNAGPFSEPWKFYLQSIVREKESQQPLQEGLRGLLLLFLDWIPNFRGCGDKFVLTHPDLDIANVIVSEDGHLQGIIDWVGIAAVPRSIGNESYPTWLTRDWDLAMHGSNEGMKRKIRPAGLWEDSPETLHLFRKLYQSMIRSHVASKHGQIFSTLQILEHFDISSSLTAQSHFIKNLLIAAGNPTDRFEIVKKFVDEILKWTRKDPVLTGILEPNSCIGPGEDTTCQNLDVFTISNALANGEMNPQQIAVLKSGFDALLSSEARSLPLGVNKIG